MGKKIPSLVQRKGTSPSSKRSTSNRPVVTWFEEQPSVPGRNGTKGIVSSSGVGLSGIRTAFKRDICRCSWDLHPREKIHNLKSPTTSSDRRLRRRFNNIR